MGNRASQPTVYYLPPGWHGAPRSIAHPMGFGGFGGFGRTGVAIPGYLLVPPGARL